MILTVEEIVRDRGEQGMRCLRNIVLPYEYEWSCVACGLDKIKKGKLKSKNFQGKKYSS